ncbi:hypothetical protein [Desertibacillus haloalkaliphilus]|uniref:hypothetical protein n=1 Tax=Desertibacillus haloalkaliphilus TaxID=1328930 RepID=UPI001C28108D|nr:hypothetical protein [Desertibacillus haloalkaliphilus]MBU8907141.1 hypothetical protein [Desertibacillus haloalkaliphilus]
MIMLLIRLMSLVVIVGVSGSIMTGGDQVQASPDQSEVEVVPLQSTGVIEVSTDQSEKRTMKVNHEVKDKDVYVDCIVSDFTFSEERAGGSHVDGEGHIHLFVDDKRVDSIYQAAFIIKGLPTGNHTIKLELAKNDHTSYGLEEEFEVSIP